MDAFNLYSARPAALIHIFIRERIEKELRKILSYEFPSLPLSLLLYFVPMKKKPLGTKTENMPSKHIIKAFAQIVETLMFSCRQISYTLLRIGEEIKG